MGDILVIIEHQDGEAKKASAETLTAAKAIADSLQGEVAAIALGPGAAATAAFAGKYGASRFYHATADNYSPDAWADLLATHIGENGYAAVCIAATSFGRDLLPHVSARCLRPTAQDVIAYDVSGGDLLLTRPVYAGKARTTVRFSQEPAFFSLRPNSVEAQEYGASAVSSELSESVSGGKSVLTEILSEAGRKLDVTEADIVVSGGRGVGGPENWHLIEDLAAALGAAHGASRAVVDAGWRPHSEQVGQTGKTVSPQMYVAVGISGAIQHLAGMSSSKYIVAINKDAGEPIFKFADFGIFGYLFEVVPRIIA
jgi:electron transfer flavoprotein alpha subunit